ncbi:hypothetical protein ACP4OV_006195 [Aristida adscensionis]
MQASRARLFKELKEVQREKSADPDIQLICDDSNIFKWTALIKGPSETPYEGGVFQLAFAIPEQYPLLPPQVRFLTKIFHPNVHFKTGEICLDILKNAWSPAWTLQSVCRAIIALMAHPEPDSPLNCDSDAISCDQAILEDINQWPACIQDWLLCQRKVSCRGARGNMCRARSMGKVIYD